MTKEIGNGSGRGGEPVRDDMRKSANHQPQQSQGSSNIEQQRGFGVWDERAAQRLPGKSGLPQQK